MKAIKLNAASQAALELAECLVGSMCNGDTLEPMLIDCILVGVYNDLKVFFVACYGDADMSETLRIPTDTLKLNPFKAMEHGVAVRAGSEAGIIVDINMRGDHWSYTIYGDGGAYRHLSEKGKITLDLDYYTQANIEGIEVIDV